MSQHLNESVVVKKVVSRKQWRYFKMVLDDKHLMLDGRPVDREALSKVLEETDYDSLRESATNRTATPRPKAGDLMTCGCGRCGLTFPWENNRKYSAACPNRPKSKAPATPMPTPALRPPGELPPWIEPPSPAQPEALPDGVLSLDAYRVAHPDKVTPAVDQGEEGRIISFDSFLQRHPERKRRDLPAAVGAAWWPALFGCSDGQ
jgi:hypothetical protein